MVRPRAVDATDEPSKRCLNWRKGRKGYLQGLGDSCDLGPLGAYYGKGKRTGVYGAYLLACYNPDDETYESVCKIGTGFSDTALTELHAAPSQKTISNQPSYYRHADSLAPDAWCEPCQAMAAVTRPLGGGDRGGT